MGLVLLFSALPGRLSAESYDMPTATSIYQVLYRPSYGALSYTTSYSQLYEDDDDGLGGMKASRPNPVRDAFLAGNVFGVEADLNFKVDTDIFGTAKELDDKMVKELECDENSYISETFDPRTLTYIRRCQLLSASGWTEDNTLVENQFLDPTSVDRASNALYSDANSFIAAVVNGDSSMSRARQNWSERDSSALEKKLNISPAMMSMLEKFGATNPQFRGMLDEAMATGNVRAIYERLDEDGGLARMGALFGAPPP